MKLKKELYSQQQKDLSNKIISILDLEEDGTITLYELDNNEHKQQEIMNLIPKLPLMQYHHTLNIFVYCLELVQVEVEVELVFELSEYLKLQYHINLRNLLVE